jgi:peptide deformylase
MKMKYPADSEGLDGIIQEGSSKKRAKTILKVAKLGNPTLRRVAKPVEVKQISSPEIQQLIQNMIETMREYGGVGLAAPQVHASLQIRL